MAVAMLSTAVRQSPTNDEPVYTVTGAYYLYEHDPTLIKLVRTPFRLVDALEGVV